MPTGLTDQLVGDGNAGSPGTFTTRLWQLVTGKFQPAPILIDTAGAALGGEVQQAPTEYTLLDRLRRGGSGAIQKITPTGMNRIAANVATYSQFQSISDNATAGSVTANAAALAPFNDEPFEIVAIDFDINNIGFNGKSVRMHIFDTTQSGAGGQVIAGDHAIWSNTRGGWVGSFTGVLFGFSNGARGRLVPEAQDKALLVIPSAGTKNCWWQVQTLSEIIPAANTQDVITPTFYVRQLQS